MKSPDIRHPSEGWDLVRPTSRAIDRDPGLRWGDVKGWVLALLALLLTTPAFAQSFPAFTGLVTDAANVLPADRKAALEKKLEDFQKQTGRQLVIATIPDLQGYAIEDYGYRLGRTWGVGLKGADNGAILIVAPNERKVRVEVGRRLEPVLTDAFSSVVIQQTIIPAFKAGDMPGGIAAGTDAIIQQLGLPDDQARAQVAKAAAEFDKSHARKRHASGGIPFGIIFWLLVAGFIFLAHRRQRGGPWGGKRYAGGSGSNWPIWLWAAGEIVEDLSRSSGRGGSGWSGDGGSSGSDGSWGGGGFTGGGGGDFGGGGASGGW